MTADDASYFVMQLIDIFRSRKSFLMTSVKRRGCKFINQLTNHFHFSVENSKLQQLTSLSNRHTVQNCTSTMILEPKKINYYWLLHSNVS